MEHRIVFILTLLLTVESANDAVLCFARQITRWHFFFKFTLKDCLLVNHVLLDQVLNWSLLNLELANDFDLEVVNHWVYVLLQCIQLLTKLFINVSLYLLRVCWISIVLFIIEVFWLKCSAKRPSLVVIDFHIHVIRWFVFECLRCSDLLRLFLLFTFNIFIDLSNIRLHRCITT